MRSRRQINNKPVRRERSETEVRAELLNVDKLFLSGCEETSRKALTVVGDDSSLFSKLLDGQSVQTSDMSTIVGDNRSRRGDDSTARRLRTNIGSKNGVMRRTDDDTNPLSTNSYFSGDHSIISGATPHGSNCGVRECTDFEVSDLDQHGIASCVGEEVADTSFDLVDGCVLLNGSLLLDEFFSPAQVQSLQKTFHEVSTEFDSAVDVAGTSALSLVKDLTCNGLEMANELIQGAMKGSRKKKRPRAVKQQAIVSKRDRRTPVPILEVRVKSHTRRTPSKKLGGRRAWFPRQTSSQVKETAPPENSPPKGVNLLRKLTARLGRGPPATKTA